MCLGSNREISNQFWKKAVWASVETNFIAVLHTHFFAMSQCHFSWLLPLLWISCENLTVLSILMEAKSMPHKVENQFPSSLELIPTHKTNMTQEGWSDIATQKFQISSNLIQPSNSSSITNMMTKQAEVLSFYKINCDTVAW